MPNRTSLTIAIGDHQQVPPDWMPATGAHPLVHGDPALVWLRYHGEKHGFRPDISPYEFLDYIAEKGQQFEDKWIKQLAPEAVQVCTHAYEVRSPDKVRETFALMQQGVPVLAQAALWWAPERIYGVPDVLVHTSWLKKNFPGLLDETETPDADRAEGQGHYVVFDMKFTSQLDSPGKARALESYAVQVRLYSYMLGQLQGIMPRTGYLITRDRIFNPLPVSVTSRMRRPLDRDLAVLRSLYVKIKIDGATYLPWRDAIVSSNLAHRDDQWYTAKKTIAWEKTPGRDTNILYHIGPYTKRDLESHGFPSLDSLLEVEPQTIPLESCRDLGPIRSKQIRAILQANRSGSAVLPPSPSVPARKEFEFYVDFEYFSNINVDFDRQWPGLEGCEMIFMVGVGWREQGDWAFQTFIAEEETQARERQALEEFVEFLYSRAGEALTDDKRTAIYHWTDAEVWQAVRASKRHHFSKRHPLRRLPWCDLQEMFLEGPIGVPGAWSYQLKDVTRALGQSQPDFDPQWPGDLDQGLRAMVMGWRAYQVPSPLDSEEMDILKQYLEADCRALWAILRWLRTGAA
jgi:predicted RecB family nuclease